VYESQARLQLYDHPDFGHQKMQDVHDEIGEGLPPGSS
jgi:hypothetical protein